MTRRTWLAVASVTILASGRVAAQEPLTLERAVEASLSHNASLRAARAGADEAAARGDAARSGWFPRISVAESWQRGDQPVFVFSSLLSARHFSQANFAIDALNHPDPIGFFNTNIGVEQMLFDGGRQRATAAAAARDAEVAVASTEETSAAVAVAATETYGRVVIALAAQRANVAALAAARDDLTRAEHRRDLGMVTDADVLALVVHVADLQQRAIAAEGDAGIARAQLNRLMGDPVEREFQIVEPSSSVAGDFTPLPDLTALLAEADAARPELKRAAASEQSADAGRRRARASLMPQLAAKAAFDISGTSVADRASSWIVGGELRWTFSTGGAELAAIRAATASAARARAEGEDLRAGVHLDVVSAVRRLESARAREVAGHAAVEQARESQRIIRDRFDAGIAPVNDVLRASTAVLDAEAGRISALADAMVAGAGLRRALGRTP